MMAPHWRGTSKAHAQITSKSHRPDAAQAANPSSRQVAYRACGHFTQRKHNPNGPCSFHNESIAVARQS